MLGLGNLHLKVRMAIPRMQACHMKSVKQLKPSKEYACSVSACFMFGYIFLLLILHHGWITLPQQV